MANLGIQTESYPGHGDRDQAVSLLQNAYVQLADERPESLSCQFPKRGFLGDKNLCHVIIAKPEIPGNDVVYMTLCAQK